MDLLVKVIIHLASCLWRSLPSCKCLRPRIRVTKKVSVLFPNVRSVVCPTAKDRSGRSFKNVSFRLQGSTAFHAPAALDGLGGYGGGASSGGVAGGAL